MLNDSDLQKAAEEMLNNDAHDEVRRIIFLCFCVFFQANDPPKNGHSFCIGSVKSYFPL